MYDPDANPKNEEQAVARSHRIGQKKPVRVVHLETVADAPPDAVQVADDEYADDGALFLFVWGFLFPLLLETLV